MFDITFNESIDRNPILAKEFVQKINAYDLLKAVKEGLSHGNNILNNQHIIDGILSSNDDVKIMLLASGSSLRGSVDIFLKIYHMGKDTQVFKNALFSNNAFNWYSLFTFRLPIISVEILNDLFAEKNIDLKKAFFSNPRMDRRVIADIIRAKNRFKSEKYYLMDYKEFDYEKITFDDRYFAISKSFSAKEIQMEDWIDNISILDRYDDNDQYFKEPFKAVLVFVRDIFNQESPFVVYGGNLLNIIDRNEIDIDYHDWLDDNDLLNKQLSSDWEKLLTMSFESLIDFFDKKTQVIYKEQKYEVFKFNEISIFGTKFYTKAHLAICCIYRVLSQYGFKNKIDYFLSKLLSSDNWVLRASGYAFIFTNMELKENSENFDKFTQKFSHDKIPFLFGICGNSYSEIFIRLFGGFDEEKLGISDLYNSLQQYFQEDLEYIFRNKLRDKSFSELQEINNQLHWKKRTKEVQKFID